MEEDFKQAIKENGWGKYEMFVLSGLADLKEDTSSLNDSMTQVLIEIGKLKVKAGIWGFIAGAIPVAIAIFISVF